MSKLINFRKVVVCLAVLMVVAFGSVATARADSVTFNISRGSTLPDNQLYGTVALVLNIDGSITVTVNMINGNKLIETGQGVSIGFNSSLSPDPAVNVTGLPAGYTFDATSPGAFGADGFGTFEYAIHSSFGANQAGSALSSLSFTVTRQSGVFSTVYDLLELSTNPPGSIQAFFAFDIYCPSCDAGRGATGFVGTGGSPIPEPASLLLLGTGLIGVAGIIRKRLRP